MKTPHTQWLEPQPVDVPQALRDFTGEPGIIAELLVRRGISTPEEASAFFDPGAYRPAPPTDLSDMDKAAARIFKAIQKRERIGVWGDFDVDGQTSTTLLVSTLRDLDADVVYHIPVRRQESHGVNLPNLENMIQQGVQVVLTCDTGISAHEAVDYARERNVDFVITDHHTLPPELPAAFAVVNPQRLPSGHPLRTLPGVGTAYQLAAELYRLAGRHGEADKHLDLVALGTIADVALLTGDARYLVQRGLEQLRLNRRLGLQVLCEMAEIVPGQISEEQVSFTIAPRLNAIGRLDDANPMVDFLTTTNEAVARLIGVKLEGLNAQRKLLCDQVFQGAMAQIEQNPTLLDEPILILSHPQWPAGVVGIVASRLVELFQRPAILLTTPPGQPARGSARSVEGINITAAIAENASLLNGFGGHPMAAGLSLEQERLPDFRRGMCRSIKTMVQHHPPLLEIHIDTYQGFEDLTLEFVEKIDQLAPFGAGNPHVIMATRNIVIRETHEIGKTHDHLQLLVEDEAGNTRRVIWWQGAGSPLPAGKFDMAYTARATNFRGQVSVSLEWIGARVLEENIPVAETSKIEVIDQRGALEPETLLQSLLNSPGVQVWREGESAAVIEGRDRNHLEGCDSLIIWNIPPGSRELEAAINISTPKRVILFGVPAASDQPQAFLARLTGLARYAIRQRAGWVTVPELACACGQREITIKSGLAWLFAKGALCQVREDEGRLQIAEGGILDTGALPRLEDEVKAILQETAAYRAFFLRANAAQLIHP